MIVVETMTKHALLQNGRKDQQDNKRKKYVNHSKNEKGSINKRKNCT